MQNNCTEAEDRRKIVTFVHNTGEDAAAIARSCWYYKIAQLLRDVKIHCRRIHSLRLIQTNSTTKVAETLDKQDKQREHAKNL